MRPVILGSILCIVFAVGGTFGLKSAGLHMDWGAPLTAMAAGVVALSVAVLPLSLVRGASHLAIAQGGLVSTLIHMLVMVATAAVVILWKYPVGSTFVFWLMGMYVITIVALVGSITGVARTAAPAPAPAPTITPASTASHA